MGWLAPTVSQLGPGPVDGFVGGAQIPPISDRFVRELCGWIHRHVQLEGLEHPLLQNLRQGHPGHDMHDLGKQEVIGA
jgi:hypothetical protein